MGSVPFLLSWISIASLTHGLHDGTLMEASATERRSTRACSCGPPRLLVVPSFLYIWVTLRWTGRREIDLAEALG
jgi:hypothetical protein